jgi:hypothetical protein
MYRAYLHVPLQREEACQPQEHKPDFQPANRIWFPKASNYLISLFHIPHPLVNYISVIWEAENTCLISVSQNQLGISYNPGQPRSGEL